MTANSKATRERRIRRHLHIRRRVMGSPSRPRLAVFRSSAHIYAQIIDDESGRTLAAASTLDSGVKTSLDGGAKTLAAAAVGRAIGERAKEAGVDRVVFDRGGYLYHGRIKALADGARSAGLDF
jgi:large subunit ribosomal protein L18